MNTPEISFNIEQYLFGSSPNDITKLNTMLSTVGDENSFDSFQNELDKAVKEIQLPPQQDYDLMEDITLAEFDDVARNSDAVVQQQPSSPPQFEPVTATEATVAPPQYIHVGTVRNDAPALVQYLNKNHPKVKILHVVPSQTQQQSPRMRPVSVAESSSSGKSFGGGKRSPCKSQQALTARENREKHKAYVTGLEHKVEQLGREKDAHATRNQQLEAELRAKNEEIEQLQRIITHDSALRDVITTFAKNAPQGMKIQIGGMTSAAATDERRRPLRNVKRPAAFDDDQQQGSSAAKKSRSATDSVGMCVHVNQAANTATFVFCASCAAKAGRCVPLAE